MRADGSEQTQFIEGEDHYTLDLQISDGWVYFCNYNDSARIYRVYTDGTCMTKLNDQPSSNIIVTDGWIYYLDGPGRFFCRMRLDGSEQTRLRDNANISHNMIIADGWVYYISNDYNINKMHTDGTGQIILSSDLAVRFAIADGWIYYINNYDSGRIYKIDTNGAGRVRLTDDIALSIVIQP